MAGTPPRFLGPTDPDEMRTLAAGAMVLLPFWYVVVEAAGRRSWTWPVMVAGLTLFVVLQMQDRVEPAVVLASIALAGVL